MRVFFKILMIASLISTAAIAADKKAAPEPKAKPIAAAVSQQTEPAKSEPKKIKVNSVTKGFYEKGVKSCILRVEQVSSFLMAGGDAAAYIQPTGSNPDKSLVTASMEVMDNDKKAAYVSTSFAPNQANGCGAVYDAVMWTPKTCDEMIEKVYADKKLIGKLRNSIRIIELDQNSKVFLLPTNDGCVTIKKELVS